MANRGSKDAGVHISHGRQIAELKKNLDNTMAVVQKHDAAIDEMKRDIKVAKSTWMRDKAGQ